jgi:integrase
MATPQKHPKSGIYYFRRAVPKDLRPTLGYEIKISLKTRDPADAKRLFIIEQTRCEEKFYLARNGFVLTHKKVLEIVGVWINKELEKDVRLRDVSNPESGIQRYEGVDAYDPIKMSLLSAASDNDIHPIVQDDVDEIIRDNNLPIVKNCEGYDLLLKEVLLAKIRYFDILDKRSNGDWSDVSDVLNKYPSISLNTQRIKSTSPTITAVFEEWCADSNRRSATISEFRNAVHRFVGLHGDVPADLITRSMIKEFKNVLQKFPRSITKKQRCLSSLDLIESLKPQGVYTTLADATINKHIADIAAILSWARDNGYFDHINWSNPTSGTMIKTKSYKQNRLPFDSQDLQVIFTSPVYSEHARPIGGKGEAAYWMPLIALFTGARLEEIGQLLVSDIKQEKGIWLIDINAEQDKDVKNVTSIRKVPIHDKLLELGFIDYIKEIGGGQIFPLLKANSDGKLTHNWSKWVNRYLKKIGLDNGRKVFHSFRHTMKDALRDAGVDEALSDAITGHSGGGVGRSYGSGYTVDRLNQAIQSVSYDCDVISNLKIIKNRK